MDRLGLSATRSSARAILHVSSTRPCGVSAIPVPARAPIRDWPPSTSWPSAWGAWWARPASPAGARCGRARRWATSIPGPSRLWASSSALLRAAAHRGRTIPRRLDVRRCAHDVRIDRCTTTRADGREHPRARRQRPSRSCAPLTYSRRARTARSRSPRSDRSPLGFALRARRAIRKWARIRGLRDQSRTRVQRARTRFATWLTKWTRRAHDRGDRRDSRGAACPWVP